ncbi:MAG: T9SS type A sorting domain-containing protein, partial [Bacteroidota bacterium]
NDKGSAIPYGLFYQTNGLENTSVWHLSFVSDSVFFAAYTDLTGAVTKDAGQSWRVNLPGNDYNTTYHTLIHPLTGVLYAAVSTKHDIYQTTTVDDQLDDASGAILKSVDGGISWEMVYNFDQPVIWLAIDPTDPAVMYASVIHSENGGIYKTHNIGEGTQWTRLNQPEETEGHPYVVEVLNDGTVVASFSAREFPENQFTPSSGVFMSSDGGQSWEKRAHPEMDFWTKDLIINPHDSSESEWLAATFRGWGNISPTYGGLYRTRDRGFTWKEIGHFSQWVESAIYHPDDPDILLVCTEHDGLWITYNASEETPDFQLIEDYPFAHPTRVFFNPYHPTTDIWVTSFGNGIRRSTEGVSPVTEFPSSRRTILIYPNPTTDWLHVDVGRTEVGMSERAVFTLYLFNRLGQQVGTWRLNAVHNRIAVDQLESGIYFYRIDHPTVHLGSGKISIY